MTISLEPIPQSTPTPNPSPTPSSTPPIEPPTCYSGNGNCLTGGNENEFPSVSTYYQYDVRGNLKQVNQGAQVRTFTYDSFSRIKTANNPESGTVSYTYDLIGNLKTKRDARGIKTIYDYDKWNRIVKRCYRVIGTGSLGATTCADAGSETVEPNSPDVSYFYDGKGLTQQQTPNFAKGRLTKVSSSVSETLYTEFDNFGRLLTHQQITDGQTYQTKYEYDFAGRLVAETYPSGKVVRNFFESDGDLSQVVKNGKTYASNFSYKSFGGIEKMRLGNGNWESVNYNERFQPIQIGLGNSASNTTNLWKVDYEYGELQADGTTVDAGKNIGNVAKQIITVPTVGTNQGFVATQTYAYDALNRLKQAKETISSQTNWQQTFSYDRFGNRNFVEANTTTLPKACLENGLPAVCINDRKSVNPTVNQANNRLTIEEGYEYDAVGNMTKDADGRQFTCDALNKQTQVKDVNNQPLGSYVYDGEGKRIKKLGITENTLFVYDGFGSLVAEYTLDNAQPNPSPNVSYLTTDTLGSPRIITGKNGEVLSRRDFLPFGEEIAVNQSNRQEGLGYNYGSQTRQSFTGYEEDTETDLEFAQNRYYSNKHGRFTTVDPLMASGKARRPQTWNRYVYVRNNPLNLTDPSGLCPPEDDIPCDENGNPLVGTVATVTISASDNADTVQLTGSPTSGGKKKGCWSNLLGCLTDGAKKAYRGTVNGIKDAWEATKRGLGFDTGTGSPTIPDIPGIPAPDPNAGNVPDSGGGDVPDVGDGDGDGIPDDIDIGGVSKEQVLAWLVIFGKEVVKQKIKEWHEQWVKVGWWTSREQYEKMMKGDRTIPRDPNAGVAWYSTAGPDDYKNAKRGAVYFEFEVQRKDLINAGGPTWVKTYHYPKTLKKDYELLKQGGEYSPKYRNPTGILRVKE